MPTTYQTRALASLNLAQALAVEPLLGAEPARLALRDGLLAGYRSLLPANHSATRHAQRLAAEIGAADPTHPHAELFALIRRLSRRGAAPGGKTVERVLIEAEPDRDVTPAS